MLSNLTSDVFYLIGANCSLYIAGDIADTEVSNQASNIANIHNDIGLLSFGFFVRTEIGV